MLKIKKYCDVVCITLFFIVLIILSSSFFSHENLNLAITSITMFFTPIIALRLDKTIGRINEDKNRKDYLFRVLMATRGKKIENSHVEALNMIQLDFRDNKEVIVKWKTYLQHLDQGGNNQTEQDIKTWIEKGDVLLNNLISEMGKDIGYSYYPVDNPIYLPKAHVTASQMQEVIQFSLAKFLNGEKIIPIKITNNKFPEDSNEPAS